jgi:hypothetical protein
MNIKGINGLETSLQGSRHYHDGANVIDGAFDGSADVDFDGYDGVLVRSNDGGNLNVEFVQDRAESTGTVHTVAEGQVLEGRVRRIYASGTTSSSLVAFI